MSYLNAPTKRPCAPNTDTHTHTHTHLSILGEVLLHKPTRRARIIPKLLRTLRYRLTYNDVIERASTPRPHQCSRSISRQRISADRAVPRAFTSVGAATCPAYPP